MDNSNNKEDSYDINDLLDANEESSNNNSKIEQDSFNNELNKCYEQHLKKNEEDRRSQTATAIIRPESHIQNRRIISGSAKTKAMRSPTKNSETQENNIKNDNNIDAIELINKINNFLIKNRIRKSDFCSDSESLFINEIDFKLLFSKIGCGLSQKEVEVLFSNKNNKYSNEGYISIKEFIDNGVVIRNDVDDKEEKETKMKLRFYDNSNSSRVKEAIEQNELYTNNTNNTNNNKTINSNIDQVSFLKENLLGKIKQNSAKTAIDRQNNNKEIPNYINLQFKKLNKEVSDIILQTQYSINEEKIKKDRYPFIQSAIPRKTLLNSKPYSTKNNNFMINTNQKKSKPFKLSINNTDTFENMNNINNINNTNTNNSNYTNNPFLLNNKPLKTDNSSNYITSKEKSEVKFLTHPSYNKYSNKSSIVNHPNSLNLVQPDSKVTNNNKDNRENKDSNDSNSKFHTLQSRKKSFQTNIEKVVNRPQTGIGFCRDFKADSNSQFKFNSLSKQEDKQITMRISFCNANFKNSPEGNNHIRVSSETINNVYDNSHNNSNTKMSKDFKDVKDIKEKEQIKKRNNSNLEINNINTNYLNTEDNNKNDYINEKIKNNRLNSNNNNNININNNNKKSFTNLSILNKNSSKNSGILISEEKAKNLIIHNGKNTNNTNHLVKFDINKQSNNSNILEKSLSKISNSDKRNKSIRAKSGYLDNTSHRNNKSKSKLEFNREMVDAIRDRIREQDFEEKYIKEEIYKRKLTFEQDCKMQLPKLNYCCEQMKINKTYKYVSTYNITDIYY